MNGLIGETTIAFLGLGNLGWLVLIATGRLKTAGPTRKGHSTAPEPATKTARTSQAREANGRFVAKPASLHEAGTEAA